MANVKNITDLPIAESTEGLNLIVNDNGAAKQIDSVEIAGAKSWNDLKDKPFGEGEDVMFEGIVTFTDWEAFFDMNHKMVAGGTYTLNIDGAEFTFIYYGSSVVLNDFVTVDNGYIDYRMRADGDCSVRIYGTVIKYLDDKYMHPTINHTHSFGSFGLEPRPPYIDYELASKDTPYTIAEDYPKDMWDLLCHTIAYCDMLNRQQNSDNIKFQLMNNLKAICRLDEDIIIGYTEGILSDIDVNDNGEFKILVFNGSFKLNYDETTKEVTQTYNYLKGGFIEQTINYD